VEIKITAAKKGEPQRFAALRRNTYETCNIHTIDAFHDKNKRLITILLAVTNVEQHSKTIAMYLLLPYLMESDTEDDRDRLHPNPSTEPRSKQEWPSQLQQQQQHDDAWEASTSPLPLEDYQSEPLFPELQHHTNFSDNEQNSDEEEEDRKPAARVISKETWGVSQEEEEMDSDNDEEDRKPAAASIAYESFLRAGVPGRLSMNSPLPVQEETWPSAADPTSASIPWSLDRQGQPMPSLSASAFAAVPYSASSPLAASSSLRAEASAPASPNATMAASAAANQPEVRVLRMYPTDQEIAEASTERTRRAIDKWYLRYRELLEYKQEHGNCNVPQKYSKNKSLGSWVNKQRDLAKRFMAGKHCFLTREMMQCLEDADFTWAKAKGDALWLLRYGELKKYFEEHGHSNVPTKCKLNRTLGRWVSTQRLQYRQYRLGNESAMTDWRIKKLNEVNFCFVSLDRDNDSDAGSDQD
jgi:hypothetical protein